MAFPQTAAPTVTLFPNHTSPFVANLPGTVNSGDLLFSVFGYRGGGTGAGPAGWTELRNAIGPGHLIHAKLADGTEGGGTISFSEGNVSGVVQVYRVTDWFGDLADVEVSTIATATSANPNSGSLTPSWGAEDTLWFTIVTAQDDDATVSATPTNYGNTVTSLAGGGVNASAAVYSARRELNATSEDPGAWTLSESENWNATTLGIRPAAASPRGLPIPLFPFAQRRSTLLRM